MATRRKTIRRFSLQAFFFLALALALPLLIFVSFQQTMMRSKAYTPEQSLLPTPTRILKAIPQKPISCSRMMCPTGQKPMLSAGKCTCKPAVNMQ